MGFNIALNVKIFLGRKLDNIYTFPPPLQPPVSFFIALLPADSVLRSALLMLFFLVPMIQQQRVIRRTSITKKINHI